MNIGASGGGSGKYWCAFGVAQQQWGYQTVHGTNPVTYDLPIPFEEAPFTVAISTGNSGNHASCGGFTKTTIVLRAGTTAGVWDTVGFFIIGCQLQWGNLWAGYTEVLNWYFPLTTSQVYAVCLTKHTKNISSGHNWEPARIEEWNNSYARIHPDGDLGYSVIAICKAQQQWGYSTGGSGAWALKFNGVYTAVVVGAPGFPAREFCGFTFDYTLTGWSFTAGYNSPVSYIRPTTTAISLGY